jgi:hypothetical protein
MIGDDDPPPPPPGSGPAAPPPPSAPATPPAPQQESAPTDLNDGDGSDGTELENEIDNAIWQAEDAVNDVDSAAKELGEGEQKLEDASAISDGDQTPRQGEQRG